MYSSPANFPDTLEQGRASALDVLKDNLEVDLSQYLSIAANLTLSDDSFVQELQSRLTKPPSALMAIFGLLVILLHVLRRFDMFWMVIGECSHTMLRFFHSYFPDTFKEMLTRKDEQIEDRAHYSQALKLKRVVGCPSYSILSNSKYARVFALQQGEGEDTPHSLQDALRIKKGAGMSILDDQPVDNGSVFSSSSSKSKVTTKSAKSTKSSKSAKSTKSSKSAKSNKSNAFSTKSDKSSSSKEVQFEPMDQEDTELGPATVDSGGEEANDVVGELPVGESPRG